MLSSRVRHTQLPHQAHLTSSYTKPAEGVGIIVNPYL